MFRSSIFRSTLCLASTALLFACPGPGGDDDGALEKPLLPIQSTSALTAANANLRTLSVGVAKSSLFLESSDFLGSFLGDAAPILCDEEGNCEPADPATLEERAEAMADYVAERILNETNVEASEPTKIVLRLKAESICANGADENGATIVDEGCASRLAAEPIRIELTQRTEGDIDVAFLFGAQALRPLQLELYRAHLAAIADIGAGVKAAQIVATILDQEIQGLDGASLSGKVRMELRENRALDYTIATSILAPVRFSATVDGETIAFSAGTASPLASMRIDGNTQTVTTETDSGAIDISIPLAAISTSLVCSTDSNGEETCEEVRDEGALDGQMDIHFPGVNGKMTLDASDSVKITGFGYDDAMTVKYDGIQILSMDLNANNGRTLDAELSGSEDGFVLAVRPLLDLVIDMDVSSLVDQVEGVPASAASDTIRLRLDGDSNPAIRLNAIVADAPSNGEEPPPAGPVSAFEVLRGRFSLSSRAAGTEVVVEAGQCLIATEPTSEGSEQHPFELLSGGACN